MSDLLPCQFCGGTDIREDHNMRDHHEEIFCDDCGASVSHEGTHDDAANLWNTPTASELVEANKIMKAALQHIASLRWKNVTFAGNPDPADIAKAALANIGKD